MCPERMDGDGRNWSMLGEDGSRCRWDLRLKRKNAAPSPRSPPRRAPPIPIPAAALDDTPEDVLLNH